MPLDRPLTRRALVLVGFLVLYAAATYLGRATRAEDSQVALAWPAAGVGVWLLWVLRGRVELALGALGLAATSVLVNLQTGLPVTAAVAFGLVNLLHAATGLGLLHLLLPGRTGLVEPVHVARLLLASTGAGLVSGIASAVTAQRLLDQALLEGLLLFVVRNGGTTFVVLAAVLALSRPHRRRDLLSGHRVPELVVLGGVWSAVYLAVFAAPGNLPVLFIALAASVWAGTRLGVPRTGALSLLGCVLAIGFTVTGHGVLATVADEEVRAVLVQAFTVLAMVVSLCLATLQRARDMVAAQLAASLALLKQANDSAVIGKAVVVRGEDGGWSLTQPNPALVALLGRDPTGVRWRDLLHPEDSLTVRAAVDAMAADGPGTWEGEVRHRRPGGALVWTQLHVSRLPTPDGGAAVVAQLLDVTARRAAQDELVRMAHTDSLTGLPNRSRLLDDLQALLDRPGGPGVMVVFLDLDRFKSVNDTYGHDAGDRVLARVGAALQGALRPGDLVSRLGGDEFVVCCAGVTDPDRAAGVGDRLAAVVADALLVDGRDVGLGVSVGTALAGPGEDAATVLRRSDAAMYDSKRRHHGTSPVPAPRAGADDPRPTHLPTSRG